MIVDILVNNKIFILIIKRPSKHYLCINLSLHPFCLFNHNIISNLSLEALVIASYILVSFLSNASARKVVILI